MSTPGLVSGVGGPSLYELGQARPCRERETKYSPQMMLAVLSVQQQTVLVFSQLHLYDKHQAHFMERQLHSVLSQKLPPDLVVRYCICATPEDAAAI